MKKTAKRLLSMALVFAMVLSLLPAMAVPALAAEVSEEALAAVLKTFSAIYSAVCSAAGDIPKAAETVREKGRICRKI